MPSIVTRSRRPLADRRGKTLVGYSSFMLLVAIAAIAVLAQVRAGMNMPPDTMIDLSS